MKKIKRLLSPLQWAFFMLLSITAAAQTSSNTIPARPKGLGDIYTAAGYPCVAAHSTTRALFANYNGPLYQIMRKSDGKTLDIGIVQPSKGDAGGYANAAAQDAFTANTIAWITKVYDQSGKGNHLIQTPPGTFKGTDKGLFNTLPIADMAPVTISGKKAYGVYIMPGMGLRNNDAKDLAINDEPEGIYYVVNGKHFSSGCCFDYGNSSTNGRAVGTATMETTYFGTATAWGSGNGNGPWIMADLEAGLFSGYNAKKNDVPSITDWQFVSAFVDGGGGNKWDLRGGNAQKGELTTYYSGVRPGTPASSNYFPMNKKGGLLLGNGGDNGNGSAGTFYEGIMTSGFPDEATTNAVQANIVAAKYDVQRVSLTRLTTFAPQTEQTLTLNFTNTTGATVTGVELSLETPKGWIAKSEGSNKPIKRWPQPIAPNETVTASFKIQSPTIADAGFITGKVYFINTTLQTATITQRVRNASPVKINEVRFSTSTNPTNQFIELYNSSDAVVDISNWNIHSTPAGWATQQIAKIPAGTKLAPKSFYLLGLAPTGLAATANAGATTVHVLSTTGLKEGEQINVNGEMHTIKTIGTAATPLTNIFIPVSTGPWLTIPKGSTNIPVTSAAGFVVGEKMAIETEGGKPEIVTVTAVGKAATQSSLSVAAKAGDNIIKVADNAQLTVGDELIINTGARKEIAKVKRIINVYTAPLRGAPAGAGGEVELTAPLKLNHMVGVDVSSVGTGISFTPATKFAHKSADAVQALGTGITLTNPLQKQHIVGTPVYNTNNTSAGYQGQESPNQWYGMPISTTIGSIALMDSQEKVVIDAMVYGTQQSNSSATGAVSTPEIATLEGVQTQGGCIVIAPVMTRGPVPTATNTDEINKSVGLFPDGNDTDNNCTDFLVQNAVILAAPSTVGANNVKVISTAGLAAGQKVLVGTDGNSETVTIANIGTTGATQLTTAATIGATVINVRSVAGFAAGQTITIGAGDKQEQVVITAVAAIRRRPGTPTNKLTDSITITKPLQLAHPADASVAGTGISFVETLKKPHAIGTQLATSIPTPGKPNNYIRKP